MLRPAPVVAAVFVLGLFGPARASAQSCPDPAAAQVELLQLRDTFLAESPRANTWMLAWGGTYGVLTAGQLALALGAAPSLVPEEDRIDLYVGAATSAVGLALILVAPLHIGHDGPRFASDVDAATDPCALLAEGRTLLRDDADEEALGTSVWMHAGNIALNAAAGLFLGVGYGRWLSGAITFVTGAALGELMIFTQPTGLLAAARQKNLDLRWGAAVAPGFVGLTFSGGF